MRALAMLVVAASSFATSAACGPAPIENGVATTKARDRDAQLLPAFDRGEDEILHDLAAIDRRLAQRSHITPSEGDLQRITMQALLREDPTVAVIDGSVDPFSFDARARTLEGAKQKSNALPPLATDPVRSAERLLLVRLIDAELMRLEEEKLLPRSASPLIRAIVETWHDAKDAREAAELDRWLSKRLMLVRESLTAANQASSPGAPSPSSPNALDVVRARELDDVLDALEHLTSVPGYTQTTQQLVLVRDALEAAGSRPAAKAQSNWETVARRSRAHLGLVTPPERLSRVLLDLETELRARAEHTLNGAHVSRDSLSLEKQVFVNGACLDAIVGSPVRSMASPHEREAACHLRHLVAKTEDEVSRATALAVMHDHVVVAEWALDVARGVATIAETQGKHHLFVPIQPDVRARYERIALARPVAALGAAEAVRVLNVGDPGMRANKWSQTIGEVPFDIAMKELANTGVRQPPAVVTPKSPTE